MRSRLLSLCPAPPGVLAVYATLDPPEGSESNALARCYTRPVMAFGLYKEWCHGHAHPARGEAVSHEAQALVFMSLDDVHLTPANEDDLFVTVVFALSEVPPLAEQIEDR